MKVIILAAGMGSRMGSLTKLKPKCFLKIEGSSLIEKLLKQLKEIGLKDISIVTGYKSKEFKFKKINYFYNKEYKSTNMVYSLMKAKKKFNDEILVIYSDIIVTSEILKKMKNIRNKSDLCVAVDQNWKKYWSKRFKKNNLDLESLKVDRHRNIIEIGKTVFSRKKIDGRFIGVIRIPKCINKIIMKLWQKTPDKKKLNWGISGRSLNKAYMTDLINKLINLNVKCRAIMFQNGWYEFDNKKDYFDYNRKFKIK